MVAIINGTFGAAHVISGTASLNAVTCPSATGCEAVGSNSSSGSARGAVVTVTSGVPGAPLVVTDSLGAVSCPSASTCEAVGGRTVPNTSTQLGEVVAITGGVPGIPELIAGPGGIRGVACPTASTCDAAGYSQLSDHSSQGVVAAITVAAAAGYQPLVAKRICDTRPSGGGVGANQCDIHGHNPLSAGGVLLRTRTLARVSLHVDLTILARLASALADSRAVPLAA